MSSTNNQTGQLGQVPNPFADVTRESLLDLPQVSGSRVTSRWGIALLILTEAVFFACLLSGYFFLRSSNPVWPPNAIDLPEVILPVVATIVLVSSSAVLIWAERRLKSGHLGNFRLGLLITILLGVVFLGIQVYEYTELDFTPQDGAYGALFYAITGLHGLHVTVGVLLLGVMFLWAMLGYFTPKRHLSFSNVSLYWHFVDGVWLFVWTSLYLSPHFLGTH